MCAYPIDDDEDEDEKVVVEEEEDGEGSKMRKMENSFERKLFDCPDLFFCRREILHK